jgi:hypothetical protein
MKLIFVKLKDSQVPPAKTNNFTEFRNACMYMEMYVCTLIFIFFFGGGEFHFRNATDK